MITLKEVRDMGRTVAVCGLALLLLASAAQARTWHITTTGTGDAPTIQAGIDSAAAGDTVLAAPGTYAENLIMKDGVVLVSSEGSDSTSILPELNDIPVITCDSLGAGTVIEGFTFAGIRSIGSGPVILSKDASVEIKGNRFADNYSGGNGGCIAQTGGAGSISGNVFEADTAADWGGAVYCEYSASPTIEDNTFIDCVATCGGAIGCAYGASPWIGFNTIAGNEATWGGGIFCRYNTSPIIKANLIDGNTADAGGGGIKVEDTERVWVRENTIQFNYALRGGGLHITSVDFANFWLNVFWGNHAEDNGGGVRTGVSYSAKCLSNTFYGNSAGVRGSSIDGGSTVSLCIIANSAGPAAVADGADIDCCDFWGNSSDYDASCSLGLDILYSDPLFCHPDTGDFHLDYDSPCVDYGDCGLLGALGAGCGTAGTPTGGDRVEQPVPDIRLPSPCYDITGGTLSMPEPGNARIVLYDARGRKVRVLADRYYRTGDFDIAWDGTDSDGRPVRPGIYFYRLEAGGRYFVRKLVFLR
jgi:hypothetical protein